MGAGKLEKKAVSILLTPLTLAQKLIRGWLFKKKKGK